MVTPDIPPCVVVVLDDADRAAWCAEHPELADAVHFVTAAAEGAWNALVGLKFSALVLSERAAAEPGIGGTHVPVALWVRIALAERRRRAYTDAVAAAPVPRPLPVLILAATDADGRAVADEVGIPFFTIITPRTVAKDGHLFRALILTPAFGRLLESGDRAAGETWARARHDASKCGVL